MDWRTSGGLCLAWLLAATAASAQQADPKPDSKPEAETTTVTITGQKSQNRIDRQTYDNKSVDTSATAADAVNKVPSVTVDPNGNVTLRGNSDVQILIDGKPSAMMSGDNRAAALQAMSSGQISSVEVMTNPGAQYGAAGSGGIINLVTAKNRKPGGSATVVVAAGIDGRHNGSFNGAYRKDRLGWTGALGYRHDSRPGRRSAVLQRLGPDGRPVAAIRSGGTATNIVDSLSASGGLDYTIGDNDSLNAQLAYARRDIDAGLDLAYRDLDASGQTLRAYDRLSDFDAVQADTSAIATWSHTGDSDGETLKADLRLSRSTAANHIDNLTTYAPAIVTGDRRDNRNDLKSAVFSLDYGRMLGENQLAAGVQIMSDNSDTFYHAAGAGSVATPDSAFAFDQTLSAAYVTVQHQFGERWTVLGGIRAEALDLDTRMITGGTTGHTANSRVIPSLFATYVLSPAAKLRFSYSHRLQRPNPQDLNPYVIYIDPQNLTAGNPALRPQKTDSFELGYERNSGARSYQLRLFYRINDDVITSSSTFVAPDILLTTRDNLGRGEVVGSEFNINTKFGNKLSLNASGDVSGVTLTSPQSGRHRAVVLNGRLNIDYAATAKDRIQVSYTAWGTQLTGQGYRTGGANASIAWRHSLTSKLSCLVSLADPFGTVKGAVVTDTAKVYQDQEFSQRSRNLIIGLTWSLGAAK